MKKILVFIMCSFMVFTTVACSNKNTTKENTNTIKETTTKSKNEGEEFISIDTLKEIPQFKSKDVKGNEITNKIFKNSKLTLINMWGTWCGPCVGELPYLQKLSETMKKKNVNVIGIVEDGKNNVKGVEDILKQKKVKYTNIIPSDKLYDDLISLISAYPTSIIVNDKGKIVSEIISGAKSTEQYIKIVDKILEKEKESE